LYRCASAAVLPPLYDNQRNALIVESAKMAEPDETQIAKTLVEWRIRQIEQRVDVMSATLATKEDVKRIENAVVEVRENQRTRDAQSFDIRKALWPPLVTGGIIAIANYFVTHHL